MNTPEMTFHASSPIDPLGCFQQLRDIPVALLSDNLLRMRGCIGLRPVGPSARIVGTALTVKTRPGDNLAIYKALTMMQAGHVLVVDGGGDPAQALVGDLILQAAMQRGCAGFVIEGAVRDVAAFKAAGFPCHARSVVHRGPYKNGPGHVNVPVCVGGDLISAGDYVVADDDGVLAFAPAEAAALLEAAGSSQRREQAIADEIATGHPIQSWLQTVLAARGLAT